MATTAPVNTIRGAGSTAISVSSGAGGLGMSARENSSVSATFGAYITLSEIVRSRSASAGALASTSSARAAKRVSAERKLAVSIRSWAAMSSTQW